MILKNPLRIFGGDFFSSSFLFHPIISYFCSIKDKCITQNYKDHEI